MRKLLPAIALLTLCGIVAGCGSKSYELDGLAAFSRVDIDDVDQADGYRLAGNLSRTLITPGFVRGEHGNGLRINANVAQSTYDSENYEIFSPQIGPSFRLAIGGDNAVYVEPGVTAGAAFGELEGDREFSWVARPYARLGYITDRFLVGVEGGYQYADLQFDLGEDPHEWYVGAFIGIRLSQ